MSRRVIIGIGLVWICVSCTALLYESTRKPQLLIHWATESEVNTAGFNLYRSSRIDGQFERLNAVLIMGSIDPLAGSEYSFVDSDIESGQIYYYQLEEVETDGRVNKVDLITGEAPGVKYWLFALYIAGILFGFATLFLGVRMGLAELSEEMADNSSTREPA